MKNTLAKKLAAAANAYRNRDTEDPEVKRVVESDYEDLMSIAGMIENNETDSQIQVAMWNLDTAVRDERSSLMLRLTRASKRTFLLPGTTLRRSSATIK